MTQILQYPKRNRIGIVPEWISRELSIVERIDLMKCPLTIEQYLRRPMIRRGRWLIRAWDVQAKCYRQFYENCFKEFWHEEDLKIGQVIDGKIIPSSRAFHPTAEDRQVLSGILWRLKSRPDVCVFSDGLRIINPVQSIAPSDY